LGLEVKIEKINENLFFIGEGEKRNGII